MSSLLDFFLAFIDSEEKLIDFLQRSLKSLFDFEFYGFSENDTDLIQVDSGHQVYFSDFVEKMDMLLLMLPKYVETPFFHTLQKLCFEYYLFCIEFFPELQDADYYRLLEIFLSRLIKFHFNTLKKNEIIAFLEFFTLNIDKITCDYIKFPALIEYLTLFLAFIDIQRLGIVKIEGLEVITEAKACLLAKKIRARLEEGGFEAQKEILSLEMLVFGCSEILARRVFQGFVKVSEMGVLDKLEKAVEIISHKNCSQEKMILVIGFLGKILKEKNLEFQGKKTKKMRILQGKLLSSMKSDWGAFDDGDIFQKALFVKLTKFFRKTRTLSFDILPEQTALDRQYCELSQISAFSLLTFIENRLLHLKIVIRTMAAYIYIIKSPIAIPDSELSEISQTFGIDLKAHSFPSKWVSFLFCEYMKIEKKNLLMFQIIFHDIQGLLYFGPFLFWSFLANHDFNKNSRIFDDIIADILFGETAELDQRLLVESMMRMDLYVWKGEGEGLEPKIRKNLNRNFERVKEFLIEGTNYMGMKRAILSCGQYQYLSWLLSNKLSKSEKVSMKKDPQILNDKLVEYLQISKIQFQAFNFLTKIPISGLIDQCPESFVDFAYRRFLGKVDCGKRGQSNDEWLFGIIYEKIMVFLDREKHIDSRKFEELAEEIEKRILFDGFREIWKQSGSVELVTRLFSQCDFLFGLVKMLRRCQCHSYEEFYSFHGLIRKLLNSKQNLPDKLFSTLTLFSIFSKQNPHQVRDFILQMIVYKLLKILLVLTKKFNFRTGKLVAGILAFMNGSLAKIDHLFERKLRLIAELFQKLDPERQGFDILCTGSMEKFECREWEGESVMKTKKKKKDVSDDFYFFSQSQAKYDQFNQKMKRKENEIIFDGPLPKLGFKEFARSFELCTEAIRRFPHKLIVNLNKMLVLLFEFYDVFMMNPSPQLKKIDQLMYSIFQKFITDSPIQIFLYIKEQIIHRLMSPKESIDGNLAENLLLILAKLLMAFPKESLWWVFPLKYANFSPSGNDKTSRGYHIYQRIIGNLGVSLKLSFSNEWREIRKSMKFLKELLKFTFGFYSENPQSLKVLPKKVLENLRFNNESRFLIAPTLQNLTPKKPGNQGLRYPYKKNPMYLCGVSEQFTVFESLSRPIKLRFKCRFGKGNSEKTRDFILKNDKTIRNEVIISSLLEFTNSMINEDSSLKELSLPGYKIAPLTSDFALIEFAENTIDLESINFQESLKLSSNHSLIKERNELFRRKNMDLSFAQNNDLPINDASLSPCEFHRLKKIPETLPSWFHSHFRGFESLSEGLHNFTKTLALWSFFCYFVGLQDRHPKNILFSLVDGKILHIDYNNIFEIGRGMEIPDNTDFRLTRNFIGNLGSLGTGGLFRLYFTLIFRFAQKFQWAFAGFLRGCFSEDEVERTLRKVEGRNWEEIEKKVDELIEFNRDQRNYRTNFFGWMCDI